MNDCRTGVGELPGVGGGMLPFWGAVKACVDLHHALPGTLVWKIHLDDSSQAPTGSCSVRTSPKHILPSKYVSDSQK